MILALITVGMIHFIPTVAQLGALGHGGGFLIVKFLTAIVLIIAVGSLGGWVATRCGQPRVVGEMVAGIMLGPSLLGQLAPGAEHWLFPSTLMPHLNLVAQMAVVAFVFLFGAELKLGLLRGSGRRVAVLGVSIVAIPVLCGILLAGGLSGTYRPDGVRLSSFVLFIGVSMGVTAFPVLIRILTERGLARSRIGTLGLAAAGVDDAIAWGLLAVAVATVHNGTAVAALRTVVLLVMFAVVVWTVLRPALRQLLDYAEGNAAVRAGSVAILLLSAVSGAFITDWIGVHAIFGAFLVGTALPRDNAIVQDLSRTITRGVSFVLPLFFAVVGLKVRIDLLSSLRDLLTCLLVIMVAMTSKIGSTALVARLTRLTWRESMGLGVMVNCRGLTELVVITTGLSLGIIEQRLFVMLVVMTLVTTMMTGPLLGRLNLDREQPIAGAGGLAPEVSLRATERPGDPGDRGAGQRPSDDREDDLKPL
ncbi:MAG TPA: cation:proton antiporter [Mycobacteriales bacterium]|nr:cation:proton antiporter [Mycobacteriales bacterium]